MLQRWKSLIPKKKYNIMQYDENKLISLMENFSGSKFQWIKTDRPELLGKVVTCRNIEPRGNKFFAVFDDGSSIDTANLNRSLLMIHGDMQPLSKAEVESIYSPRPSTGAPVQNMTGPMGTTGGPGPIGNMNQSTHNAQHQSTPQATTNMFEMFNSEESKIDLQISIKLPAQDFLKMMYVNAKEKDTFLNELSEYIFKVINKQVVKDSISSIVIPQDTVKHTISVPIVNITEIHE
jgi:hypothetical protein